MNKYKLIKDIFAWFGLIAGAGCIFIWPFMFMASMMSIAGYKGDIDKFRLSLMNIFHGLVLGYPLCFIIFIFFLIFLKLKKKNYINSGLIPGFYLIIAFSYVLFLWLLEIFIQ